MIVVRESRAACVKRKPVICPKCTKGKIGSVPAHCGAVISRRGTPPPDEYGECLDVRCKKCGSFWSLTIE